MISVSAMLIAGIVILGVWPCTNPWVVHAKSRILGPRLVYGPLAYDDDLWEVVLVGVRSGDSAWLRVAVDLRPSLDTHPGEEMLGAVSSVLDKNPIGALDMLLPLYGPSIVCAEDDEGAPISRVRAKERVQLLERMGKNQERKELLEACLGVLWGILASSK
jgi:hypothetical protein